MRTGTSMMKHWNIFNKRLKLDADANPSIRFAWKIGLKCSMNCKKNWIPLRDQIRIRFFLSNYLLWIRLEINSDTPYFFIYDHVKKRSLFRNNGYQNIQSLFWKRYFDNDEKFKISKETTKKNFIQLESGEEGAFVSLQFSSRALTQVKIKINRVIVNCKLFQNMPLFLKRDLFFTWS